IVAAMRRGVLGMAIVASACGAPALPHADGGADGGIDARTVEPVRTCDLSLETGARCAVFDYCADEVGDGFCARRLVRCVGGYVVAADDTALDFDIACFADEVALEAGGPDGSFVLDRGTISVARGFTESATLLFSSHAPYWSCETPRLRVAGLWPELHDGYVGTYTLSVSATLYVEDREHALTGTVEVTAAVDRSGAPLSLVGTLSLAGDGHTVSGPFDVTECPHIGRTSL
ncbi:MAG TPA: hypothetical protein VIL20_22800, partial [Sandaracinaceae bacterium]